MTAKEIYDILLAAYNRFRWNGRFSRCISGRKSSIAFSADFLRGLVKRGTSSGFQRKAVLQACGLCNGLFGRQGGFHLP